MPEGFSTYTPNCIEASHKSLKNLLSGKAEKRDVGKLLVQIGDAMQSRADNEHYHGLRASVDHAPSNLIEWPRKRTASLHAEDPDKTSLQVSGFVVHLVLVIHCITVISRRIFSQPFNVVMPRTH